MKLFFKTMQIALWLVIFYFGSISFGHAEEIKWLKLRQEIGLEEIINAIFVPGDTTLLVTDANFKLIELDTKTGELKREIPNIRGAIKFSDDGQYLYTYGWEKVKWPTGEVIGKYPVKGFTEFSINEKAGLIVGVAYQSDHSPWLWKRGIWVLDLKTFKLIDTLGFQKNYYYAVQMTDDGKYFMANSEFVKDYTHPEYNGYNQFIWDTKTLDTIPQNSPIGKINNQLGIIKTSPDGKWLCSVAGSLVRVFDNTTFEKKYEWRVAPDSSGSLTAIDISSDSRYLVTSGYSGLSNNSKELANIRIFDLLSGKEIYKYRNGYDGIDQGFIKYNYSGSEFIGFGPGAIIEYHNMINSVSDKNLKFESILYPNQTTGLINLKNIFQLGNLKIELFDLNGILLKVLFDGVNVQSDLSFDISYVPAGVYFVQVKQNDLIKTFKVIKL